MAHSAVERFTKGMETYVQELTATFGESDGTTPLQEIRDEISGYGMTSQTRVVAIPRTLEALDRALRIGEQSDWPDPFIHDQIQNIRGQLTDSDFDPRAVGAAGGMLSPLTDVALVFDDFDRLSARWGPISARARDIAVIGHELVHGALAGLTDAEVTQVAEDTVRVAGKSGLHQQFGEMVFNREGSLELSEPTPSWLEEAHAARMAAKVVGTLAPEVRIPATAQLVYPFSGEARIKVPGRYISKDDAETTAFFDGGALDAYGLDILIEADPEVGRLISSAYTDPSAVEELHEHLEATLGHDLYVAMVRLSPDYDSWVSIFEGIAKHVS